MLPYVIVVIELAHKCISDLYFCIRFSTIYCNKYHLYYLLIAQINYYVVSIFLDNVYDIMYSFSLRSQSRMNCFHVYELLLGNKANE